MWSVDSYVTVTVTGSMCATNRDGSTGLVLRIEEGPPIAFAIDLQAISHIREALAQAEQVLLQQTGHA
jgi:hypothetical protein